MGATKMRRFMHAVGIVFLFILVGCGGFCSDKVNAESSSPDNVLKATWFERDCGATTDFSEIVSIHKPDNTYKDDSDIVFVAKGRGQIHLSWSGPRHLSIECIGCQRKDIFKEVSKIGDIDVTAASR